MRLPIRVPHKPTHQDTIGHSGAGAGFRSRCAATVVPNFSTRRQTVSQETSSPTRDKKILHVAVVSG
jgi:hypothetical protein